MTFRDFGYAFRTLRKSPVFTLTAVLTIALGIGASTAIFSVANAVLLRPLPYKDPGRLVFVISDMRKRDVKDFPVSHADFMDMRTGTAGVFEGLGAVLTGRATVPREDSTPEQVRFGTVTPNFFRLMGHGIAAGRDFEESDGQAPPPAQPGAAPGADGGPAQPNVPAIAILSYEYWQRRFGGDPSILGRSLPGAPQNATRIVGVLAPRFELLFPADANVERLPDIWFAVRLNYDNAARNTVSLRAIGRLRDGVSMDRAQAAADAVAAELRKNHTIKNTSGFYLRVEPLHRHVVEAVRPALYALVGAVVFLLLIACANVANLMLVRASVRERELAVRTALGGNWWRLVSQTLAESLLLALAGAGLGLGLAYIGIQQLVAIAPPDLPRLEDIGIDPAVLLFAALTALVSAAIFGVVPALRSARPDIAQVLRASGRGTLGGAGLLRNGVVVAEVALSFVLLIGSGLMARSFLALQRIHPGYNPQNLLTFTLLRGPGDGQQAPELAAMQRRIRDQLATIPGVRNVSATAPLPLAGGFSPIRWGLEPALTDPSKFQAVDFQIVLPGYFETVGTPLLSGRTFTEADNVPERNGVVIDQVLAAKAFPKQSALGKRLLIRIRTPEAEWVEVIGVVGHQRNVSLADPGREQIYFTDGFVGHGRVVAWLLRTEGDPTRYAAAVRAEIARIGRQFVITELQPMEALVHDAQTGTRFSLLLIGVFAGIAALLAAIGLYGVMSTLVRQRTPELGVRMALGAAPAGIFGLVVRHGMLLSAAGIVAGAAAAFALTRLMTAMLVGVKPTDPATFVAITILFLLVTVIACWMPARRAARLDPTVALRND